MDGVGADVDGRHRLSRHASRLRPGVGQAGEVQSLGRRCSGYPYASRTRTGSMDDLRLMLIEAARRHSLGGVAVAVALPGEEATIECMGMADRRRGRAVAPDTVLRIASISKTLTAIGLMQLHEDGRFQLDEPVNNHLKTFRVEAPPGGTDVTFRHLLTHTAGIGELPRVSDLVHRAAWGVGRPGAPGADL
ncbi:MAG: beta-lactamase family protein, partial [Actinobacteria bacterium]